MKRLACDDGPESSGLCLAFRHHRRHRPAIQQHHQLRLGKRHNFINPPHLRKTARSLFLSNLLAFFEDRHGRQDGRRRGRLCSCRQRSHRRAAFTMYFCPSVLSLAVLTCSFSHHRQLRPPRPSRRSLRWTLYSSCTSFNIERAQEPSSP